MRSGLVVVSHPDPASLNHALATSVVAAWAAMDIAADLLDLHAIGFDPVLDLDEARGRPSRDPAIRAQIDALGRADLLAVVHPNCWGAPPAMMKGWMDRVFAPGAAYAFAKGEDDGDVPVGLLRGKRALVLNTSNTAAVREAASFGDPLERIWRDCLLGYCGFERIERRVFRIVATSREAERRSWIAAAADAARNLAL
ncbi:NAD(P)H-dependent oxidoreductase [Sphingosinicella sp. BN140058]|uniref:NAD(P)H-dependent oxidoreductase n=1 Tax=Sphingosinicella sp. BN140058 TaxID=1892855 RepID=UPI001011F303|nr:NAD(P)H-dependent oxidoreductase [Sphingosinicella sp. BN140058]QAY76395.1 flavodoxin family protein [Sphingosinicella sp. BN140058]